MNSGKQEMGIVLMEMEAEVDKQGSQTPHSKMNIRMSSDKMADDKNFHSIYRAFPKVQKIVWECITSFD